MKMKNTRKGVRGNNRLSNALNKPISGSLAKQASFKTKAILLTLVFLVLLFASISKLGVETGIYFAVGFSIFGVVIYFTSRHETKKREEIIKKHPWKSFDDRDN